MDISREDLENLIADALLRDCHFRPQRRHWAQAAEHDPRRARLCAAAIVTFLHNCGVRWAKLPAAPPHSTLGE
jgi:hypothetical protein